MSTPETFEINFANGVRYDLDEIRQRRQSFMPDGEHAWVIHVVYGVDDPDGALDNMELGAEEFVGVTDITCLLCFVPYQPEIRHHKCTQQKPEQ